MQESGVNRVGTARTAHGGARRGTAVVGTVLHAWVVSLPAAAQRAERVPRASEQDSGAKPAGRLATGPGS